MRHHLVVKALLSSKTSAQKGPGGEITANTGITVLGHVRVCVFLTLVMCEGCPVLLAVLHLLHHHQSSSLHVHGQCVLLTLSNLCQFCQINLQLDLQWTREALHKHTSTHTKQGVLRAIMKVYEATDHFTFRLDLYTTRGLQSEHHGPLNLLSLYYYHIHSKPVASVALTKLNLTIQSANQGILMIAYTHTVAV